VTVWVLAWLAGCGEPPAPPQPVALAAAPAVAPEPVPLSSWSRPGVDGQTVALTDYADRPAVVLIAQGNACPVFQQYGPTIQAFAREYAKRGVPTLLINASPQDDAAGIAVDLARYGMSDLPVFVDQDQAMARALEIVSTTETLVIDPSTWTIVFRGAIDDQISYDGRKDAATKTFLRDAVDDVLAGQPVRVPKTRAYGCAISFRR
jgi:hypothetical protein